MNKQKLKQIKKSLTTLLVVLFAITTNAVAVNAGILQPEPLPIPLEDHIIVFGYNLILPFPLDMVAGPPEPEPLPRVIYFLTVQPVPLP